MGNNSNQQKKVTAVAFLISIAIHIAIILASSRANQVGKINITQNRIPVKIHLIETRAARKITAEKLKPKAKQSIYRILPKPITQSNPSRVSKQPVAEQQKGDPTGSKPKTKPFQSNNMGSEVSEKAAIAANSNVKSSKSLSSNTGKQSSQARSSIIPKEKPRCRQCREPRIPRRAERRGEEGYATFRLTISSSGLVVKTQLLTSSGHSDFINSARKAAMSSTFYPMTQQNTKDIMYIMEMKKK